MEALAEPELEVVDSIAVARLYGEPLFDLDEGLRRTVAWYVDFLTSGR